MGLEFLYHLPLLAALVTFCGLREGSQKQGEEEKREVEPMGANQSAVKVLQEVRGRFMESQPRNGD